MYIHICQPIWFINLSGLVQSSPAETPKCWILQFQTEVIFADNFPNFAGNLKIYGKLSANMASVWICKVSIPEFLQDWYTVRTGTRSIIRISIYLSVWLYLPTYLVDQHRFPVPVRGSIYLPI